MDSISRQVNLAFQLNAVPSSELVENWQKILNISGSFSLSIDDRVIYSESDFCLLELAVQLQKWLRKPVDEFQYESMETEEKGWVWIKKYMDGWSIGSIHQKDIPPKVLSKEQIISSVREFVNELRTSIQSKLGIDVSGLIFGTEKY